MNAYVNHNRWIASCPTPYCTEAHSVNPGDSFECGTCLHSYGQILFPEDKLRIDFILARRLIPETRNWYPGETVEHLESENALHKTEGVAV